MVGATNANQTRFKMKDAQTEIVLSGSAKFSPTIPPRPLQRSVPSMPPLRRCTPSTTPVTLPTLPPRPKRKSPIATQESLFKNEEGWKSEYTAKILAPIYEPKNKKPDIFELVDRAKSKQLSGEILTASISPEERDFLLHAAQRHNVFNYKLIADYYAHASPVMQRLMEASALVIIDFNDAIREGYVKFSEEVAKIYVEEHGKS